MIYVLSDIHGNRRRFDSIMSQIQLKDEDTLYVLGDVIDRYPDGIRILRELMRMPNVKMLLGNHEYMMLEALDAPYDPQDAFSMALHEDAISLWYRNGGRTTHNYLKHIRKEIRAEIFQYLRNLPYNIDVTVNGIAFKLVHGAPMEMYSQYEERYRDEKNFAVWKRLRIYDPIPGNYTLIFGHTTTKHYNYETPMCIWKSGQMIGIDCGSGHPERKRLPDDYCGRLACLRLDDMKEFYSEESEWDSEWPW